MLGARIAHQRRVIDLQPLDVRRGLRPICAFPRDARADRARVVRGSRSAPFVPRRVVIACCEATTSAIGRVMKMTLYWCCAGSCGRSIEMHLIARPSTSGVVEQLRLFADLLDRFPFVIAARIVDVGDALVVGHGRQAAGLEHLHHERSAGTRQAGDEDERLARISLPRGFGSGRSLSKVARRSSRFGISGRSKSLLAFRIGGAAPGRAARFVGAATSPR